MSSDLMNGKISTVFFDFDGVIAESVDVKTKAFAKLFEEHGADVVEKVVQHHLAHSGVSRFEKIRFYYRNYLGKHIDDEKLEQVCDEFSNLVLESVIKAPYVPGAFELLEDCRDKYDCYVISGTPQDEMEVIVDKRNLSGFFTGVYGSPAKKIDIMRRIMSSRSLRPDEVVCIGDAMTDYNAAKEAGIFFIGRVPNGDKSPFPPGTLVVPDLTNLSITEIFAADNIT